jgi:hypothetical protein
MKINPVFIEKTGIFSTYSHTKFKGEMHKNKFKKK